MNQTEKLWNHISKAVRQENIAFENRVLRKPLLKEFWKWWGSINLFFRIFEICIHYPDHLAWTTCTQWYLWAKEASLLLEFWRWQRSITLFLHTFVIQICRSVKRNNFHALFGIRVDRISNPNKDVPGSKAVEFSCQNFRGPFTRITRGTF